MVFGSREMVSGHRSMVLPGSDMPSALGLVSTVLASSKKIFANLIERKTPGILQSMVI